MTLKEVSGIQASRLAGVRAKAEFLTSRLYFGPQGWDLDLKAGIWASRLGFWPKGWDFGLKAGIWVQVRIWASRL